MILNIIKRLYDFFFMETYYVTYMAVEISSGNIMGYGMCIITNYGFTTQNLGSLPTDILEGKGYANCKGIILNVLKFNK